MMLDDLFKIIESLGSDDDFLSRIELPESDDDFPETTEPLIPSKNIDQLNSLLSSSSDNCEPNIYCFFPSTPLIYHEKIERSKFYNADYFKTIDLLLERIHFAAKEEINDNFHIDSMLSKIINDDFEFDSELKEIVTKIANNEKYKNKNANFPDINLAEVIAAAFSYPDQYRDKFTIAFVSEYRNLCTQHKIITPFKLRCDLIERINSIRETLNKITTKFLNKPDLELDGTAGLPLLLINISKSLHDIQSYYLFNKAITPSFISNLEDAQKSLLIHAKPEIRKICIGLLEQLPEQLSLKKGKDHDLIEKYLHFLKKENPPKEKKSNKI